MVDSEVCNKEKKSCISKVMLGVIIGIIVVIVGVIIFFAMGGGSTKQQYFLAEGKTLNDMSNYIEDRYEAELDWLEVAQEEPDRKSTRLNSSHVAISYAVFCLKKKNQNRHKTA